MPIAFTQQLLILLKSYIPFYVETRNIPIINTTEIKKKRSTHYRYMNEIVL
jgi:hypothetical protein